MPSLREYALHLRECEEGIACEGTPLEKRTIKVRNKAFLFLGPRDTMLKLRESLPEAEALAAAEPDRYRVGVHGWVTVVNSTTPHEQLERWVYESWRLMAPKGLRG